jgi:hypothetical protein
MLRGALLTGNNNCRRLSVPTPIVYRRYDVFLSYSHKVDGGFAERLFDCQQAVELGARGRRPEVFLDSYRLEHGKSLTLELVRAVQSSRVMTPIVSVGALDELARAAEGEDTVSYLLLEWWAAVELHSADMLARVLPIVLGFNSPLNDGSTQLVSLLDERDRRLRRLPKAVSTGTHRELAAAFAELGLEAPKKRTVREVVSAMFDYVAVCTVALGAADDVIPPAFHPRNASSTLPASSSAARQRRHSAGSGTIQLNEEEVWNVEMQCSTEVVRACEAVLAVEHHTTEFDGSSEAQEGGGAAASGEQSPNVTTDDDPQALDYDATHSDTRRKVIKKLTKALAKVEEQLLEAEQIVAEDIRNYAVLWADMLRSERNEIIELERECVVTRLLSCI